MVLDAIFGFSFKAEGIREPFKTLISQVKESGVPVISVDVPSGWNVDVGVTSPDSFQQVDALISLTAPKLCAKHFEGVHYLGGRFVPDSVLYKYKCIPPTAYEGSN